MRHLMEIFDIDLDVCNSDWGSSNVMALSLFVKFDQFLIGSSADKTEEVKSGSSQQATRIMFQRNILNGREK